MASSFSLSLSSLCCPSIFSLLSLPIYISSPSLPIFISSFSLLSSIYYLSFYLILLFS